MKPQELIVSFVCDISGSPWDEDKAMMGRWGLEGMRSFEQSSVARKEGFKLAANDAPTEKRAAAEIQSAVV